MKLIVGLGNPGQNYQNTRHNIGYMVLDNYLGNVNWKTDKLAYVYKNNDVIYIKPTTYMNLSGSAVEHYLNYYKIEIKDLLVIQDDMDLDIGCIRLKKNSSSGGHNGIKDIIKFLNTNDFLRLKIGISKPDNDVIDYVLSKFNKEEQQILNDSFSKSNSILDDFINDIDVERLMNKYN